MKKYLVLSFLFLLVALPIVAKSANSNSTTQGQSQNQPVSTVTPAKNKNTTVTPTGQQIENQNQVQTKNQGQEKKLQVQTQEAENLNQEVEDSAQKVSDQVQELLQTVGVKSGIGQQVREFAQNQEKNQEKIKSAYYELKNRGQLVRLFVGSDKKMTKALEQLTEENKLTIQTLEELKTKTLNQAEKIQLQETIDLMLYQNTSLGGKIAKEKQVNGLFGWFIKLFSKE